MLERTNVSLSTHHLKATCSIALRNCAGESEWPCQVCCGAGTEHRKAHKVLHKSQWEKHRAMQDCSLSELQAQPRNSPPQIVWNTTSLHVFMCLRPFPYVYMILFVLFHFKRGNRSINTQTVVKSKALDGISPLCLKWTNRSVAGWG